MKTWKTTIFAFFALLFTVGSLWFSHRSVIPKQATWGDVLREGKNGGYQIITTDELAQLYRKDSSLRLVDTRQEWEYRTGHIKGAANFPVEPAFWARWLKASDLRQFLGPDKNQTLVFY